MQNKKLPSITYLQTGDIGELIAWPFSSPSTKTKYKTMHYCSSYEHETETKPSDTALPQRETTAHAGKKMFLLWMFDEHGL